MSEAMMEFFGANGATRPTANAGREKATRDALARYVEARWPVGRRKSIEREWGLTPDEARAVCEATASASTIDKIWQHPRGGWSIVLPVMAAVVGQRLDDHITAEIEELRNEQDKRAARLATLSLVESRIGAPGSLALVGPGPTADGDSFPAGSGGARSADLGGREDRPAEVATYAPTRNRP